MINWIEGKASTDERGRPVNLDFEHRLILELQ